MVPKTIRIELFNQAKKGMFSVEVETESLGYVEITTDSLVRLDEMG